MKKLVKMIEENFHIDHKLIQISYKDDQYDIYIRLVDKMNYKTVWGKYKELNKKAREDIIRQLKGRMEVKNGIVKQQKEYK